MKIKFFPCTGGAYTVIFSDTDGDAPQNEEQLKDWIDENTQNIDFYEEIHE